MTNFQPSNCKRCLDCFSPAFAEQLYCAKCRRVMVAAEDASIYKERLLEQSKGEISLYMDTKIRDHWDIRIIDEVGREVWARDLADRYRKELNARRKRDYRERT